MGLGVPQAVLQLRMQELGTFFAAPFGRFDGYSGEQEHASQDLHLKQNALVIIHGEHPFSLGYGHNLGTRSGYFCPRFAPVAPLNALYSSRFLLRILVVIPS
jgi:hypothetical protein